MGKVFVVGNFKGGSGKTKICTMLAFDKAVVEGKKTLVIDLDPQANATQALLRTGDISSVNNTMGVWLKEVKSNMKESTDYFSQSSLKPYITSILPNLDLIAGSVEFRSFNGFINRQFDEDDFVGMSSFLKPFIDEIAADYDFVYIDVLPTLSETTDNAIMASDYSIIAFQTTEESLDAIGRYITYQKALSENLGAKIEVIGILTCMVKPSSQYNQSKMDEAKEIYGDLLFDEIVPFSERLANYSNSGISLNKYMNGNYDQWDFRAHYPFIQTLYSIDQRIEYLENLKGE